MNDGPSDLDRLLADFERLTAGAPRPAPAAVGRTIGRGVGRLAQTVVVLVVVGVVGIVFVGALALTSPTGGPPATVDGLPVMTVSQVLDARAAGGLRDQQVAVGGYWSASDIVPPCVAPTGTPGALEMYCEDGLSGISELNEPILVEGSSGMQRASGPYLTPYIPSSVEGLGDLGPGSTAWGAGDGHAPVPIVVVGHFDDPLAAECRPEARQLCLDRLVVDKIAYFAADVTATPTAAPTQTPSPTASAAAHVARLEVTGSGTVGCIGYGGCYAWLVLRQTPTLSGWEPNFQDPAFSATRTMSGITLLGPVDNAPPILGNGWWSVGLAYAEDSDSASCTGPCSSPSFPIEAQGLLCSSHFVVTDETEVVSISADFGPPCGINVSLQTSKAATAPPTTAPTDAATAACAAIIDNIPLVRIRSGQATIAAAHEVTGEQMTRYFVTALHHSDMSNGADWWHDPSKLVDMCVFEGDFITMTPGPSPSGDVTPTGNVGPTVTRVLVVINNGDAEFWASGSGVPLTNPATIPAATSSPAAHL
jgi:hypothetical protein